MFRWLTSLFGKRPAPRAAVELRCKELAEVVAASITKKASPPVPYTAIAEGIERLLVEIATGATSLVPNKRQISESMTKGN